MPSTILSDNGVSSGTAGIKTTGSNDGQLALQTTTAGGTATTAMTIDTSQNVGVGVISPGTYGKFVVSNSVGGAAGRVVLDGNATSGYTTSITATDVGMELWAQSNSRDITFNTGTTKTERGRFDTSGNFLFNSGYGSVATAYGCRAWVNFNGTGTVAIRASGNVSSITDNGTGDYTVNFTTAMPNANYSGLATCRRSTAYKLYNNATLLPTSTSAAQVCTGVEDTYSGEVLIDSEWVSVAIFR